MTELAGVPPEKRTSVLSVRMPSDVFQRFARMAAARGEMVSDAARRAIEAYSFDDPDTENLARAVWVRRAE